MLVPLTECKPFCSIFDPGLFKGLLFAPLS